MRRQIFRGPDAEARALLGAAHTVHLASTTHAGEPVLRALHAATVDEHLVFHGAPVGEKVSCLGRRAVVSAERVIASIPSWFLDPDRACPATTYYVSAQAHGVIEEITSPDDKARALAALMRKYQPEGRHAPIDAASPLYAKAVRGLLVARVALTEIDGKVKIGQNRSLAERARILDALWSRGGDGDAEAIETLTHLAPDIPEPAFAARAREGWRAAPGTRLCVGLRPGELDAAVDLLRGAYWLTGVADADVADAITRSSAVVGARTPAGELCAIARATSDGRTAWIYDVMVAPSARGAGVGAAIVRLLLDHPAVRRARVVRLGTRDADGLYRRFGFRDASEVRSAATLEMARLQATRTVGDAPGQNVKALATPA